MREPSPTVPRSDKGYAGLAMAISLGLIDVLTRWVNTPVAFTDRAIRIYFFALIGWGKYWFGETEQTCPGPVVEGYRASQGAHPSPLKRQFDTDKRRLWRDF